MTQTMVDQMVRNEWARKRPDYTGRLVTVKNEAGHRWFAGIALERTGECAYRFKVLWIGGKRLSAEMVVDLYDLTLSAFQEAR